MSDIMHILVRLSVHLRSLLICVDFKNSEGDMLVAFRNAAEKCGKPAKASACAISVKLKSFSAINCFARSIFKCVWY